MKAEVEEISLHKIDRDTALKLRNEIQKATGGTVFHTDQYPALHELFQILGGCFDSMKNGVHFISKREDS